ncbi:hypothetical protein, partial [Phormidium sp. CCY1219]|uniref:hypothetical protein n=1 Tax=Phormidium sp. CCY1219 TaxID=2886104 RepID=UPI002D1F47B2
SVQFLSTDRVMAAKKLFRLSVQFLSTDSVVVEKELFRLFQGWSGGGQKTIPLIGIVFFTDGVVVEKKLFSCRYSFFPALE